MVTSSMKSLIKVFLACLLTVSWAECLSAQADVQAKKASFKCSISLDSTKLESGSPALVSISIQNISGGELSFKSGSQFELLKLSFEAKKRNYDVLGDSYWAPLDLESGDALKLRVEPEPLKKGIVVGHVPEATLRLAKDEIKIFKVDL